MDSLALLLTFACLFLWTSASNEIPDDQRLLDHVRSQLHAIDPFTRPLKNSSDQLQLYSNLQLMNLINLDQRAQTITLKIFMINLWKNEFVSWNVSEFGGKSLIFFPKSEMWSPDLDTFTRVSDLAEGDVRYSDIWLLSDGTSALLSQHRLTLFCELDLKRYPYDEQVCSFGMTSWIYTEDELSLDVDDKVDERIMYNNSEFEILRFQSSSQLTQGIIGFVPIINASLAISRHSESITKMVFYPTAFLTTMSGISFLLPPSSESKAEIQLSVMLSFAVYSLLINDQMPPSSEIPFAGEFLITIMGLNLLSLLVAVLTINLSMNSSDPPPLWLYTASRKLGCVLCCSRSSCCKSDKIKSDGDAVEGKEFTEKHCNSNINGLHILTDFIESHLEGESIREQWMLIAKVLDRVYFCCFIVATAGLFISFIEL